jgi:hypothetical protein
MTLLSSPPLAMTDPSGLAKGTHQPFQAGRETQHTPEADIIDRSGMTFEHRFDGSIADVHKQHALV